ncbi:VanZ family protein [Agromyces sp. NPDC056523]|uniref:VanZ family protein n=1 Tax=Agromyces sp. NPDC056523 TaxID=3345850 RepID=UPI00367185AF
MTSDRSERRLAASARLARLAAPPVPRIRLPRVWIALVTVAYSIGLGIVLFWPVHVDGEGGLIDPTWLLGILGSWGLSAAVRYPLVESAGNALMFLPLGALWIAWVRRPRWRSVVAAMAIALAVSLAAEIVQARYLPARTFDPRDMIANTVGAGMGAAITLLAVRSWFRPTGPVLREPRAG